MLKSGIVSVIGVLAAGGLLPGCSTPPNAGMAMVDAASFPPESTATLWVKGMACPG